METPVKSSSIRRKPNGFLMVQVKGKFTTPRPLYANPAGLLLKIGSDASNHIQIKNAEVAPFHAELRQITFQGQSKVIIQDCRPSTNFLPILVGTQAVPDQSNMVLPQDMPNVCIGSHKFVFLYTIPPMLMTMYPTLAQQEWMQYYTTPASTNPLSLSQSQPTDMLSQSMELPPSNLNAVKKEEPIVTPKPAQQYSQERTLTASSSGSINAESEPETQPNIADDKPSSPERSESEYSSVPENSAKDDPQSGFYSLNFSQRDADVEEEPPSKPQPKSKKASKRSSEPESTAESTIENLKSETSESEAPKTSKAAKTPKKKPAPKSAKKQTKKEPVPERSEEEHSTSELERLANEYITHAEELSQSESSSTEQVKKTPLKKTPKKVNKTPVQSKSTSKKGKKGIDWTCTTCGVNKQANMVDCQTCGAWHHCKCVGYDNAIFFVCDSCKDNQDPIAEEDNSECPLCHHLYSDNIFLPFTGCDGCNRWFHQVCIGGAPKQKSWMCEECLQEGRQRIELLEEEPAKEEEEEESISEVERVVVDLKNTKGRKILKVKKEEPEESESASEVERVVVDLKDVKGKGSQSAKKATKTKKMTRKAPNTVATSKSRKVTTPKKTPSTKKTAPVPPSDSEGQEPSSSSDESDSDEKENVYDTFKLRQKEGQFVPKISSKFAYFKSPPMDLAKTRLQQKTSPAPKKLF